VVVVGLYSAIARKSVIEARELINKYQVGSSAKEILRFRNEILSSDSEIALNVQDFIKWPDFYATSEIRDLLFHVQEKQYVLPEIKSIIDELGFVFAGFDFSHELFTKKFSEDYPNPEDMFNLDLWHEFELRNTGTFVGMYQFWLQKI